MNLVFLHKQINALDVYLYQLWLFLLKGNMVGSPYDNYRMTRNCKRLSCIMRLPRSHAGNPEMNIDSPGCYLLNVASLFALYRGKVKIFFFLAKNLTIHMKTGGEKYTLSLNIKLSFHCD